MNSNKSHQISLSTHKVSGYGFTCESCKSDNGIDRLSGLSGKRCDDFGVTNPMICLDCLASNYLECGDQLVPRQYNCKCCDKTVNALETLEKDQSFYDCGVFMGVCEKCFNEEVSVAEGGHLVINQYNPDGSLKSIWVDENGNAAYICDNDGELYKLDEVIDYIRDLEFGFLPLAEIVRQYEESI